MKNHKIHFGFENWRGILDSEINLNTLAKVAQAFAGFLVSHSNEKDIPKVGIAYDGRRKSKDFALLFSRVLSGNNIIVFLTDKISATQMLACFVKENNLNAGIMITGGRFPSNYNGIKFISQYGSILNKSQLNEIEEFFDKDLVQVDDEKIYQVDIRTKYYEQLESIIDFNSIKGSGINLLIDSMAGAGQQVLENLLIINDIRSKTIFKFSEKDFAGRIPDPLKANLTPVINEVKKSVEYSFTIATDGDADRVTIITDQGDILDDNQASVLLADYLFNNRKENGRIIKSLIHTEFLRNLFGPDKIFEAPVGLRFFSDSDIVNNENILIGFEGSGSFIWGNGTPYRDGILTSLFFAEMIAKSGYKRLSDYINSKSELTKDFFCNQIILQNDKEDDKLNLLFNNPPDKIGSFKVNSFHSFKEYNDELNSTKFTLDGECRWVTIRKSDNFPQLKIYAEGNNENEIEEILHKTSELLQK